MEIKADKYLGKVRGFNADQWLYNIPLSFFITCLPKLKFL